MRVVLHLFLLLLVFGFNGETLGQKAKVRREIGRECVAVSSGRADLVVFPTRTGKNVSVPVEGILMKPSGTGPFAAVVILHGGPGIFPPRCYVDAQEWLLGMGYAALVVDSDSAGYPAHDRVDSPTFKDRTHDAWAAAKYLATRADLQVTSIGLIGWSLGGLATLLATSDNLNSDHDGAPGFAAAVAIGPECVSSLTNLKSHLLILHGEEDQSNPVADCQNMQVTRSDGAIFELVTYPGAGHLFDFPGSPDYDPVAWKDADMRIRAHFRTYLSEP